MDWQIRGLNVRISQPLARYAEQKLREPLDRFANRISKAVVRFKDPVLNNLKSQREAVLLLTMSNGQVLQIKQEHATFYDAINALSDRMKRTVNRRINKQRDKRRRKSTTTCRAGGLALGQSPKADIRTYVSLITRSGKPLAQQVV